MFEHLRIPLSTGYDNKYYSNNNNNTATLNHINYNDFNAALDNFRVIGSASNDFLKCLKKAY